MTTEQVKTPDIGGESGEIIEILVAVGDSVEVEQSLVVLESAKASLEIPCPQAGKVSKIHVAVGDSLNEGDPILDLETEGTEGTEGGEGGEAEASAASETDTPEPEAETAEPAADSHSTEPQQPAAAGGETQQTLQVPDIGSEQAEVIEVSVKPGDSIDKDDTLVVAESDKASLDIPAEAGGKVETVHVNEGDKISQGMDLVTLLVAGSEPAQAAAEEPAAKAEDQARPTEEAPAEAPSDAEPESQPQQPQPAAAETAAGAGEVYAGPAVRKLARELGVDLRRVKASGPRGRILKEDVQSHVKSHMQTGSAAASGGGALPGVQPVDWAKFGPIETQPMSRVHKLTADAMTRNWLNVPHVTQFDDADVTELEQYRQLVKAEGAARGIKMTPLAFLLRASAKALKAHPKFNSSLHEDGDSVVYRQYCHIGVAVDTEAGLMVPVIRDVDQKDIWTLAQEIADYADKAKNNKLKPAEMQGAGFTISSLGAIGGTGFTPIVTAPQAAILGVSKTAVRPVWDGETFQPRTLMPLALSYDHKTVNGADAGRFLTYLVEQLASVENIWSD